MIRYSGFVLVALLLLGAGLRDRVDRWVAETDFPVLLSETSDEIRDRNGALLRVYTVADGRWRLAVDQGAVDQTFLDVLIAYEDKRFNRHSGVDPWAMLRAAGQALWHGEVVSGGSTLTMQVARLLEESGTGAWQGKLRQMRVALALERRLTKDDILNLYLLHAPYGGNLEGLRAATLAWFGKEPARLTPAEAALLVALPQAPEARRPDRAREVARQARDRVLERMARAGVLTVEEVFSATSAVVPHERRPFPALAPHLADRMRAQGATRLSVDAHLQTDLEALAEAQLQRMGRALSIAVVVADHATGEGLASIGSGSFASDGAETRQGYIDMTRAVRSPGSTLKPLVYGLAFDRGLAHPQTLIDDSPVSFDGYAPQNFDGEYQGQITVADALRQSRNIPVVRLTKEIGPAHVMAAMRRAGMTPVLPEGEAPGLAISLGGVGVSLEGLVALYGGLARGGAARGLTWVRHGQETDGPRILSRAAAWQVGDILGGLAPPAGHARNGLAYKTGTSYGHRDAWAVGFDGQHVVGVWIGRADGTPVPGAFGAELAAPVLFEVFQRLKPALTPLPPPPPETLIVQTAELPQPLQRFRGRDAAFAPDADAPKLVFPPEGARLAGMAGGVVLKLKDGRAPFTVMVNGRPVLTGLRRREAAIDGLGAGFSDLTVIDAAGRADSVSFRLE